MPDGRLDQIIDHAASLQRTVRRLELELALLGAAVTLLAAIVLTLRLQGAAHVS